MLSPLLAKLGHGADSNEITDYLHEEIRGHFGMSPERAGTASMAQRLIVWPETGKR